MNPYNQRKEPIFGQPSASATDEASETEKKANQVTEEENVKLEKPKIAFSLHTKNSPGYTFTPVMKRPADSVPELSTLEEKAEQTMSNEKKTVNEPISPLPPTETVKPNGGFTFAPVAEEHQVAEPLKAVEKEEPVVASNTVERVIPAAAVKASKASIEKVPSKYRRLIIVLLLLLLVGIAIVLLKPKTPESVEILQEQGSSLPIEFRPVDEEEAKRAEAQAKALQEQATEMAVQPNVNEQSVQNSSAMENVTDTQTQAVQTAQTTTVVEQSAVKPVEHKPVVTAVRKPETAGSVIYQPEVATKLNKVVQAVQPKNAQPKPAVHVVQSKTVEVQKSAEAVKVATPAPIVKAVPAVQAPMKSVAAVASKTLTVPKGVSLMQVFRDNNLNISDVNAMSKVNGIVSNLKVGERVTVRLDKNNRVAEMSIGSGGKFIRQENGSYIYR